MIMLALILFVQTDPMKRATVEDIRKHEWFTKDCPKYLFPDRVTDTSIVDTDAIAEVSGNKIIFTTKILLGPGQSKVWS